MPRIARLLLVLAAAALLLLLGWRQYALHEAEKDVYSGTIEAEQSRIGSKVGGRVGRLLVREGSTVRKGDRILEFDSAELRAAVVAAKAAERQAQQAYQELVAGTRAEEIERARAVVQQAQSQVLKLERGSRPQEVSEARAAVEQAQARLDLALKGPRNEDVSRARAALEAAEADTRLALTTLQRVRELHEGGAVSLQALDEARRRAAVARATEQQARETLNELRAGTREEEVRAAREALNQARQRYLLVQEGPRDEDVAIARGALRQARAALAQAEAGPRSYDVEQGRAGLKAAEARTLQAEIALGERAVYAPRHGQIQTLSARAGDILNPGQPVATLIDPDDLYVRFYLPARKLYIYRIGDRMALVTDDGLRVTGTVEQIPAEGEFTPRNRQTRDDRDLEVFAVKVRLDNPERRLRAGMSVSTTVDD